jgi:hypothetical protein
MEEKTRFKASHYNHFVPTEDGKRRLLLYQRGKAEPLARLLLAFAAGGLVVTHNTQLDTKGPEQ